MKRGGSPVLLLTATPIQNSLAELWGLVQYVEPTGTLLGRLSDVPRAVLRHDDRAVLPEQAAELQRRLQTVLQRTLRRQAQEFLEVPFVDRPPRVFEYAMSPEEKALYDDVTAWLMREDLFAFRGNQRHLLLIGFHRRMASSLAALSVSLQRVAQRLRERLRTARLRRLRRRHATAARVRRRSRGQPRAGIRERRRRGRSEPAPLQRPRRCPSATTACGQSSQVVEAFAARAAALGHDSKARRAARRPPRHPRGREGRGTGKAVIFTESLTTQDYLRQLLLDHGFDAARRDAVSRRQRRARTLTGPLQQWEDEVGQAIPPPRRPSREVATPPGAGARVRAAVAGVHLDRGRRQGPQPAVLRHGHQLRPAVESAAHRAADRPRASLRPEARRHGHQLPGRRQRSAASSRFEILTQKLDLFGKVLDASDAVLYDPSHPAPESLVASVGVDFEKELRSIYSSARSIDDVTADLEHLRATMDERRRAFDDEQARASSLVESTLDDAVRQVFAKYRDVLPAELEGLDRDVDTITREFFDSAAVPYARVQQPGRVEYRVEASDRLPEGYRDGFVAIIGEPNERGEGDVLYVGHPVVQAAIADARDATVTPASGRCSDRSTVPPLSRCGVLPAVAAASWSPKVEYRGIEPVDTVLNTAILDGDSDALDADTVESLLALPLASVGAVGEDDASADIRDAVDEAVFADQAAVSSLEESRFRQMLRQLDHYLADQVLLKRRKRDKLDHDIHELEKKRDKSLSTQSSSELAATLDKLRKASAAIDREIEALAGRRRRGIPAVARPAAREAVSTAGRSADSGCAVRDRRGGVMLKILHTADLHLGLEFGQLDADDRRKLARARLAVVAQILNVADQFSVDAVLWAGDIFDAPGRLRGLVERVRHGAGRAEGLDPAGGPPSWQPRSDHGRGPCSRRGTLPRATAGVGPRGRSRQLRAGDWRARGDLRRAMSIYRRRRRSGVDPAGEGRRRPADPHRVGPRLHLRSARITRRISRLRGTRPCSAGSTTLRWATPTATARFRRTRQRQSSTPARRSRPASAMPAPATSPSCRSSGAGARPHIHRHPVARWQWRDETISSLAQLRALAADELIDTVLATALRSRGVRRRREGSRTAVALLKGTSAASGRAGALIRRPPPAPRAAAVRSKSSATCLRRSPCRREVEPGGTDPDQARRALRLLAQYVSEAAQ